MSSTPEGPWPGDWNRASLGLCTLAALSAGPTYGYAIITALQDAGLGTFKGGTLYPLLARFESAGWVEVDWRPGESGPDRKYFSLTPTGVAELESQRHQWRSFTTSTTAFLAQPAQPTTDAVATDAPTIPKTTAGTSAPTATP